MVTGKVNLQVQHSIKIIAGYVNQSHLIGNLKYPGRVFWTQIPGISGIGLPKLAIPTDKRKRRRGEEEIIDLDLTLTFKWLETFQDDESVGSK